MTQKNVTTRHRRRRQYDGAEGAHAITYSFNKEIDILQFQHHYGNDKKINVNVRNDAES